MLRLTLVFLALSVAVPGVSFAQDGAGSDSDLAEARARFIAGSAAVEAGRWADAVENFERAYSLSKAPSALFNLGVALRALGQYRRARDTFAQLLDEHSSKLDDEMRNEAQRFRVEMADQVASLSLTGLEQQVRYRVRMDGKPVTDEGARPMVVEVDPGEHNLTANRDGYEPFVWDGSLARGEKESVHVTMKPLPKPKEESPSVFSRPAFWVVTGLVLAAAGGTTAFFLVRDKRLSPDSNNVVRIRAM